MFGNKHPLVFNFWAFLSLFIDFKPEIKLIKFINVDNGV